ncbi:MAG: hypothetical protein R6U55_04610, partial [Desulfovermiculus sp.]
DDRPARIPRDAESSAHRHDIVPVGVIELTCLVAAIGEALIRLLRLEVTPWDRFSIRQRHFVHEPISPPERFGLVSHAASLEAVFEDAGLARRRALGARLWQLFRS